MKEVIRIALLGAIVVLVYDTVSSFLSIYTTVAYGWFLIGSSVLYMLFGYLAARRSKWFFGGIVGALLGLVDSTLGWAISWNIGPGKADVEMNLILIVVTGIFVTIVAAMHGLIGGAAILLNRKNA